MSLAVKAAMLASKDLGKNERLVLLAIAAHQNAAGDSWPSVPTIAEYVGCSERTVQRCLAKLITLGRLVWRHVAGVATRVYRIVTSAVKGVTDQASGVTNPHQGATETPAGGDTLAVTRSGEDPEEEKTPARVGGRLDWRRYVPGQRGATPSPKRQSYPERRGAALPPPPGAGQCPKHQGSLAGNCGPCRSERLAGGAR